VRNFDYATLITLAKNGEWLAIYRALFGKSSGPGQFVLLIESMSDRAARYQSQISGRLPDVGYQVDGVNFDGYDLIRGVLLDAKGPGYAGFVKDGKFRDWFRGQDSLIDQAQRQLNAANGHRIEWHIAEEDALPAFRRLFRENNISGINLIHTPATP